jgi:arylsulfatase A-like enzyme
MNSLLSKHVVLIVFDYMGYGDIEPFGRSEIRTPVIRQMAEQGIRYTDCYAPAPICVPSRAAMLTGRYPRHLGIERNINPGEPGLPVSEKTVARYFKDAGFSTALYGKWHLGYEASDSPYAHGFDDFIGFHHWNIDYYSHNTREGRPGLYHNDKVIAREGYSSDIFTDEAVAFIARSGGSPFFLYVAYNAGLPPYSPPGRENDKASFDLWHNGTRADYAAMVEHLDKCVGRILAALEDQGLAEDAVVLLTYDHGGAELATKGPFFHGFGTLWEGGIRVPAILRWPAGLAARGIAPGTVSADPAILMDATSTLLAVAGLEPDQVMDGHDLLSTSAEASERCLYWQIDLPSAHENWRARAQRAVRRGKWKYLWDGGFEFLYDLDSDPGERENLGYRYPDLVSELRDLSKSDW